MTTSRAIAILCAAAFGTGAAALAACGEDRGGVEVQGGGTTGTTGGTTGTTGTTGGTATTGTTGAESTATTP